MRLIGKHQFKEFTMPQSSLTRIKRLVLCAVVVVLISFQMAWAKTPKITVFGSSVASGAAAEDHKGYWFSLKECMAQRGWDVSGCSRGGDRTSRILDRFDDLLSHKPDYVFIGLSLANEGIRERKNHAERDAVYIQYKWGMQGLIALLRGQGIEPVVGLCYPHGQYTPIEIDYVRRMNLLINTWDVPSANFLGAVDDTSGQWATGYENDPGHPNTAGHREMFYAIVPSLFDALEAGRPNPTRASGPGSVTLGATQGRVRFKPKDTVHSWATSFWIKGRQGGTTLASAGPGVVTVTEKGLAKYHSGRTHTVPSKASLTDGMWHHVVVSHMYAQGQTQLYVDNVLAGKVKERVAPESFEIGGDKRYEYKEWLVYRAALNAMEVNALFDGKLLQASLEVYAPLQDKEFKAGVAVENRAQSLSKAIFED
jgi:lysophospholipase L1-like esterase